MKRVDPALLVGTLVGAVAALMAAAIWWMFCLPIAVPQLRVAVTIWAP
jgi:hypothetical protein